MALTPTPFPNSTIGPQQQPWFDLLNGAGTLPGDPSDPPLSYQIDGRWEASLATATGWRAALCRGVLYAARGESDAAAAQWTASVREQPNAWAHRNLGALARHLGALDVALDHYRSAHDLSPHLLALTVELLEVLSAADKPNEALDLIARLPAEQQANGRVRLAQARAALAVGDLVTVAAVLQAGVEIADIREGETSLTEFWDAYQDALAKLDPARPQRDPLPRSLDFRMSGDD